MDSQPRTRRLGYLYGGSEERVSRQSFRPASAWWWRVPGRLVARRSYRARRRCARSSALRAEWSVFGSAPCRPAVSLRVFAPPSPWWRYWMQLVEHASSQGTRQCKCGVRFWLSDLRATSRLPDAATIREDPVASASEQSPQDEKPQRPVRATRL